MSESTRSGHRARHAAWLVTSGSYIDGRIPDDSQRRKEKPENQGIRNIL